MARTALRVIFAEYGKAYVDLVGETFREAAERLERRLRQGSVT